MFCFRPLILFIVHVWYRVTRLPLRTKYSYKFFLMYESCIEIGQQQPFEYHRGQKSRSFQTILSQIKFTETINSNLKERCYPPPKQRSSGQLQKTGQKKTKGRWNGIGIPSSIQVRDSLLSLLFSLSLVFCLFFRSHFYSTFTETNARACRTKHSCFGIVPRS